MKMNIRFLSAAALVACTSLMSCTKEAASTSGNTDDNTTELTTHSDDASRISVETDAFANEATLAMESTTGFSGNALNVMPSACDATVGFDTTGSIKKMTITFNGAACSGEHLRTGSIVIAMAKGVYWKNAGAEATITFQNLKITRIRDQKSVTLNGIHTLTNISGGLLQNLPSLHTITHTISSSDMSVTFDDSTQRTWQLAKKRVFTYNNGVIITITGNHTEGTNSSIAIWGVNRFGHVFTTTITQPLVIRQDCNFRLTSGTVLHQGWATATAMFGLDAAGNVTTCPGTGSYYFKLDWTGLSGKTHRAILAY